MYLSVVNARTSPEGEQAVPSEGKTRSVTSLCFVASVAANSLLSRFGVYLIESSKL